MFVFGELMAYSVAAFTLPGLFVGLYNPLSALLYLITRTLIHKPSLSWPTPKDRLRAAPPSSTFYNFQFEVMLGQVRGRLMLYYRRCFVTQYPVLTHFAENRCQHGRKC